LIRVFLFATLVSSSQFTLSHAQDSIWESAAKGDVDTIEDHIDAGADLNELSESGSAPLHFAVSRNRVEIVALLLDADADPDVEDSSQGTPLELAIAGNKTQIIDLLLEADAFVEAPTVPLQPLVWEGDMLGVKLHIYAGTDIDQEDEFGNYPLLLAVEKGFLEIVDLFITHEIDLYVEDQHGFTSVIVAAEQNHPKVLQLLLDSGADINVEDKAERTALDWAIIMQSTEAEEILRENDAPTGAEKSFIAAIQTNNTEAVRALLDKGADVNEPAYTSKTPLHYASHSRNMEILKLILSKGADVEALTEQGFTPLGYAVGLNHPDNCRALLEAGADVNTIDNWNRTNLNVAAALKLEEVAGVLLEFEANPNTLDAWHYSSLDVAEEFGTEAIAELIHESGGINGPKISIHAAAASGDNTNLELHLFFGTELNLLTENNETPMDAAALNNQTETVEFLQEQTALSIVRDDDGDRLIHVVGPYGNGDTTPQLEFVIEASSNFSDWEIVEAVDTNEGVGETVFEIESDILAKFLRVAINEIED
jgi:ankyrin repeat protein